MNSNRANRVVYTQPYPKGVSAIEGPLTAYCDKDGSSYIVFYQKGKIIFLDFAYSCTSTGVIGFEIKVGRKISWKERIVKIVSDSSDKTGIYVFQSNEIFRLDLSGKPTDKVKYKHWKIKDHEGEEITGVCGSGTTFYVSFKETGKILRISNKGKVISSIGIK